MLTASKSDIDAVGCPLVKQAGLRGAGVHIHLLDAAVFGTCKEKSGLPGLLCLLTTSHPTPHYLPEPRSTGRNHSPQSMKRRGSARAVAPRARSKASDDSTMTAASAGRAAASPRRHVSSAAPPAGQLGGARSALGRDRTQARDRRRHCRCRSVFGKVDGAGPRYLAAPGTAAEGRTAAGAPP